MARDGKEPRCDAPRPLSFVSFFVRRPSGRCSPPVRYETSVVWITTSCFIGMEAELEVLREAVAHLAGEFEASGICCARKSLVSVSPQWGVFAAQPASMAAIIAILLVPIVLPIM